MKKPVIYTRQAILQWLQKEMPDIDWAQQLGDELPPVIHRSKWHLLCQRFGLPFSRGHIANMDSKGEGPKQIDEMLKNQRGQN